MCVFACVRMCEHLCVFACSEVILLSGATLKYCVNSKLFFSKSFVVGLGFVFVVSCWAYFLTLVFEYKAPKGGKSPKATNKLVCQNCRLFFLSSFSTSAHCLMTPYCFEVDSESPRHFAPLDYMESPEEIFRRRHDDKEVTFPLSYRHFF